MPHQQEELHGPGDGQSNFHRTGTGGADIHEGRIGPMDLGADQDIKRLSDFGIPLKDHLAIGRTINTDRQPTVVGGSEAPGICFKIPLKEFASELCRGCSQDRHRIR